MYSQNLLVLARGNGLNYKLNVAVCVSWGDFNHIKSVTSCSAIQMEVRGNLLKLRAAPFLGSCQWDKCHHLKI